MMKNTVNGEPERVRPVMRVWGDQQCNGPHPPATAWRFGASTFDAIGEAASADGISNK
jgi:hypothetical protein